MADQRIQLSNQFATVEISSLGAELKSLRDASGVERLWSGDATYWTGQAPIMFPIVGGLHDDAYTLDGKTYSMGKHGFARLSEFAVEAVSKNTATFTLSSNDQTRAQYPFEFIFRVSFSLDGPRLAVTYEAENLDSRVMPLQFGAHEAYACPEGIERYAIRFNQPESLDRYELTGSFLNWQTTPWLREQAELALHEADFERDAIVFLNAKSDVVSLCCADHDRTVDVDFPDFETLMIWTKPGAPYICIEPWCGSPDFVDGVSDLRRRHRIHTIAPGEHFKRVHGITLR